jgi:tetratricopeptide (TPR) repeat protein
MASFHAPAHRGALLALALLASAAPADEQKKPAYPFALPPEKAIAALNKLEKLSGQKRLMSDDEKALAADVKGGRFRKWSMAEAALLADGADAAARKELLQKYDRIVADAKKAVAECKTPAEKGKKLLEVLYAGPMKKPKDGYESGQTRLSVLLAEGKFNCVSSAVLYNAVAADVGLQVDAVEEPGYGSLPGHVYSRLRAGDKWLVVETTNDKGFALERRWADSSRILTPAGLVAEIWTNRAAAEQKRHHDAAVFVLLGLSIDPGCSPNNCRAALGQWALGLSKEEKFADAQLVHAVALEIDPKDPDLHRNREVVYLRWADHLAKAGKTDGALDVLRRAIKEDPSRTRSYERKQTEVYTSKGEALLEAGEWQKAHDSAAPGRGKLTGQALKDLVSWQRGVYLRWGNRHLKAGEHGKAMEAYQKGLAAYPDDLSLDNNLWVAAGAWLSQTLKSDGEDKARELAATLRKNHKGKKIEGVLNRHVGGVLAPYLEKGQYAEARAALKRHAHLLSKDNTSKQTHRVIDGHAASFWRKGEWKAAHEVYAKALKELPGDAHLLDRGADVWDRQAQVHLGRKEWKEAIAIYEEGLKAYPNSFRLKNNLAYSKQELERSK